MSYSTLSPWNESAVPRPGLRCPLLRYTERTACTDLPLNRRWPHRADSEAHETESPAADVRNDYRQARGFGGRPAPKLVISANRSPAARRHHRDRRQPLLLAHAFPKAALVAGRATSQGAVDAEDHGPAVPGGEAVLADVGRIVGREKIKPPQARSRVRVSLPAGGVWFRPTGTTTPAAIERPGRRQPRSTVTLRT